MADPGITQKEKIQILLGEYSALRGEINARITNGYQVTAIGAALVAWLLQQDFGLRFWIGLGIGILGTAICSWFIYRDVMKAGMRVYEIERDINERAGETLLRWEHEFGALVNGYWQLSYFLPLWRRDRAEFSQHNDRKPLE